MLVDAGFVLPDLMVIDPVPRDRQPTTARLVVEVSVTTFPYDTAKAERYAKGGVDEYWIADTATGTLVVHREPSGDRYARITRHKDGTAIQPLVNAAPVDVTALFG